MSLADSLTTMLSAFVNAFVWAAEVLFATVLLVALTALICLVLRWAGRKIADKRAQLVEPETYGDQGGMPEPALSLWPRPKAPHIGCGLPAGREMYRDDGSVPTKGKVP